MTFHWPQLMIKTMLDQLTIGTNKPLENTSKEYLINVYGAELIAQVEFPKGLIDILIGADYMGLQANLRFRCKTN